MGIFSDAKGQLNPQLVVGLHQNSNTSKVSCMSSLPASMIRIWWKTGEKMWQHRFPHYKPMGAICCHWNQSSDPMQPFPNPKGAFDKISMWSARWLKKYLWLKVVIHRRLSGQTHRRRLTGYNKQIQRIYVPRHYCLFQSKDISMKKKLSINCI